MKTSIRWLLAILLPALLAGCDDNYNNHDHDVPPGKGSLIVDNNTQDEISIFIDGHKANIADENESKSFDLRPGLHRVVLDQNNGDRTFSDDVDILEGRRTVLDVGIAIGNHYDVAVLYD